MAPRLKVFRWSDGFHALSVAATSRRKALQAWGSRQDLFASGLAEEISEGPDHEAALARPGQVVERGLAVDVGKIGPAPRRQASPEGSAETARRRRIETAERRLAGIDRETETLLAGIDAEIEQLQARRAEAEAAAGRRRKAAREALRKARAGK